MRVMSTKKSKTAQRRETSQALSLSVPLLSLDITPEQYELFDGLADSYNRMWGVARLMVQP